MKGPDRLKGSSTLPAMPREIPAQDRLLRKIKNITSELDALQLEIYSQLSRPALAPTKRSAAHEDAAKELGRFRTSLDQLRHVLWFYLDQFASSPDKPLKQARVDIALHPPALPLPCKPASGNSSGSFFDRLDVVIDACMKAAANVTPLPKRSKP